MVNGHARKFIQKRKIENKIVFSYLNGKGWFNANEFCLCVYALSSGNEKFSWIFVYLGHCVVRKKYYILQVRWRQLCTSEFKVHLLLKAAINVSNLAFEAIHIIASRKIWCCACLHTK